MKIAIVNSVAGISSKELAEFLRDPPHQVDVFKPFKDGRTVFRDYDCVFNYGYGGDLIYNKIINTPAAVMRCVHKPSTFECFKKAKVDTVEYTTDFYKIPKHWETIVVREDINGRKAEGLHFCEQGNIRPGELYSEYFEHKHEYRVVVFMGKVVGFYHKTRIGEDHHFMIQPRKGFEKMGEQAIAAAKAIGIDYVGFDVVAKDKKTFKFLEANSAPILTAEAMESIWEYFFYKE